MTIPQFLADLLQLLFGLAVPSAICTLVLAGLALRQESGVNFEVGGRFQRWMLWSVILLTLPQFLSWFAAQGITMPPQGVGVSGGWLRALETSFIGFVSDVLVAKLLPILAAFLVLKAALDAAQGASPLGSIVAALFLLTISGTVALLQGFNSGGEFATVDMLASLWNYVANTILPGVAGLAVVGAVINYARRRPFMPLVFSALSFLSVSALWKLAQTMVNVILPLYGVQQVVMAVLHSAGVLERLTIGDAWVRNVVSAMMCFGLSGLLRLAESFIQNGTAGVR